MSRRKDVNRVYVCDTDDGVEELIKLSDLSDLIMFHHLEVKGVFINTLTGTVSVYPYQDMSTFATRQTKMKMLRHVDIKVWNGFITDIFFKFEDITEPVEIVLSEFGTKLAARVLDNCYYRVGGHKITLIFDNSVSLEAQALASGDMTDSLSIDSFGVAFDVTRVTDIQLLAEIYIQLFSSSFIRNGRIADKSILMSIFDIEGRRSRMLYYCESALFDVVHNGKGSSTVKAIAKRVKDMYVGGRAWYAVCE